jgi:hypothetical protein
MIGTWQTLNFTEKAGADTALDKEAHLTTGKMHMC